MDIVAFARAYAVLAHGRQMRGNGVEPFIVHLDEVARLMCDCAALPSEVAAAYLHDVVEDVEPVTIFMIEEAFGCWIADVVETLTQPHSWKRLPTFERKLKQAERMQTASLSAKLIKIADQASNLRSMATHPPRDARQWRKCVEYVEGARRVVHACSGQSRILEQQFERAYEAAVRVFGRYKS